MQHSTAFLTLRPHAEGRPEDAALADFPLEERILVVLAEDKQSQELQKIRQDIREEFATISASTKSTFNGAWAEVIKEMLEDPLEQLVQHRKELNAHRQEQNQHLQRLHEASTAANALIHRIHTT